MMAFSVDWIAFIAEKLQSLFSSVKPSTLITAEDIDWAVNDVFHKTLLGNTTFTFSNTIDGKVLTVALRNSFGDAIGVAFPAGVYYPNTADLTIDPSMEATYTFIKSNGKIYLVNLARMSNTF